MGNFSRETFDRLKHYVGVRLQQGVPIVDADWNEQEDIRRDELRTFLKWFVGNGVPVGNDGFRVTPMVGQNNFEIASGRCLVEGWDVINDWNERTGEIGRFYQSQRLFGNEALARDWSVAPLPALTTPAAARTDRVYLDVWEREVGAAEDPSLVNPAIGIETSVRRKREWVVRVAEGAASLPAAPAGHVFYELATLFRTAGDGRITAGQIIDRRRTGLGVLSHHDVRQITTDAFGAAYTLDGDGNPNLKISLREAVNSLLRGQLPGTTQVKVTENATHDTRHYTLVDCTGAVWVFYRALRNDTWDIQYNRFDPVTRTWSPNAFLTNTTAWEMSWMSTVQGKDGSVWLFYSASGLQALRHTPGSGWGAATSLTPGVSAVYPGAVVDADGDIWLFWQSDSKISYKRYSHASGSWGAITAVTTSTAPVTDQLPRAVVDGNGDVWVFWARQSSTVQDDIYCKRYIRSSNTWSAEERLSFDPSVDSNHVPLADARGDIWVFWNSHRTGGGVYYRRYSRATGTWGVETQLTQMGWVSSLVLGSDGDIWAFSNGGDNGGIWCLRYTGEMGWGKPIQVATQPDQSFDAQGLLDPDGNIWVVWYSFAGFGSIYARKLIPAI